MARDMASIDSSNDMFARLNRICSYLNLINGVRYAIRWAFYSAVVVATCLIVMKLFHMNVGLELVMSALIVPPLAAGIFTISKGFSSLEGAIYLDSFFKLEERLATAVEIRGRKDVEPLYEAQIKDAYNKFQDLALDKVKEINIKKDITLLAMALIITGAILSLPDLPIYND